MASMAISPMLHSQTARETWIVEKNKWESALEQGGVDPTYAEETLAKLKLVTLSFAQPQNPTPAIRLVEEKPLREAQLLKNEGEVSVYYAANPRVRNHLWITLNREADCLADVTPDEAVALRRTVNKTLRILREQFNIPHSVIAQWNQPRSNHLPRRFTIEIIPSRPETAFEHNVWDKIESNNYVISNNRYITSLPAPTSEEAQKDTSLWTEALAQAEDKPFNQQPAPEPFKDWTQIQTNRDHAAAEIIDWLHQSVVEKGVAVERQLNPSVEIPGTLISEKKGCAFCLPRVIDSQKVYETDFSYVLYNFKPAKREGHFLILPKRHVSGSENLTEAEVRDMHDLTQRLTKILEEKNQNSTVSIYTQDGPSVGQTVPHSHIHLLVSPSDMRYLFFSINYEDEKPLTKEQMLPVLEEFGKRLAPGA